jgi:hypothetical protein
MRFWIDLVDDNENVINKDGGLLGRDRPARNYGLASKSSHGV